MYDVCKDKIKQKEKKTFFVLGQDLGKNKVGSSKRKKP
jgi:hypothetical protein